MNRSKRYKGCVLLVDDKVDELHSITRFLMREGYEVLMAPNAAGAVAQLSKQAVDLVITDYNMPLRNGMDLFREIRATYPELPVIMMTGLGTEKLAADFMRERGSDYLTKPVNLMELLAKVKRGIGVCCERNLFQARQTMEDINGSLNLAMATLRTIHAVAENVTGSANKERVREILYLVKQSSRELAGAAQLIQTQQPDRETDGDNAVENMEVAS
uniref:Response regulatory domain-containing protein n=1 Tax=Magnetococcus massalia (strain MO-1) TaxID=451514 RepID=A0A1S7LMT5_MAGMO|nr:protein of unknown function [Candidatus Magnetococcus massalia]